VTNSATVTQVIRYLGFVTLLLCGGVIYLAASGTTEAVFTPIVTLAGTGLGALGALLVHTGSVDPAPTPEQAAPATEPDDL